MNNFFVKICKFLTITFSLFLGWVLTGYAISERIDATNENADRTALYRDAAPWTGNNVASDLGGAGRGPRELSAEYNEWLSGALRNGTVETDRTIGRN